MNKKLINNYSSATLVIQDSQTKHSKIRGFAFLLIENYYNFHCLHLLTLKYFGVAQGILSFMLISSFVKRPQACFMAKHSSDFYR